MQKNNIKRWVIFFLTGVFATLLKLEFVRFRILEEEGFQDIERIWIFLTTGILKRNVVISDVLQNKLHLGDIFFCENIFHEMSLHVYLLLICTVYITFKSVCCLIAWIYDNKDLYDVGTSLGTYIDWSAVEEVMQIAQARNIQKQVQRAMAVDPRGGGSNLVFRLLGS